MISLASYHINTDCLGNRNVNFLFIPNFGWRDKLSCDDLIIRCACTVIRCFIICLRPFVNQKLLSNLISNDIINWILCKIKIYSNIYEEFLFQKLWPWFGTLEHFINVVINILNRYLANCSGWSIIIIQAWHAIKDIIISFYHTLLFLREINTL